MAQTWATGASSDANGGDCVEVTSANVVLVRDSKYRGAVVLTVSAQAWQRFMASLLRSCGPSVDDAVKELSPQLRNGATVVYPMKIDSR